MRLADLYSPDSFADCHPRWPDIVMDLTRLLQHAVEAQPVTKPPIGISFKRWTAEIFPQGTIREMLVEVGQRYNAGVREVAQAFRVAMTGKADGLPIDGIVYVMGRDEIGSRTVYVCTWHCPRGYWPFNEESLNDPN